MGYECPLGEPVKYWVPALEIPLREIPPGERSKLKKTLDPAL
jgi:hypothetical protein